MWNRRRIPGGPCGPQPVFNRQGRHWPLFLTGLPRTLRPSGSSSIISTLFAMVPFRFTIYDLPFTICIRPSSIGNPLFREPPRQSSTRYPARLRCEPAVHDGRAGQIFRPQPIAFIAFRATGTMRGIRPPRLLPTGTPKAVNPPPISAIKNSVLNPLALHASRAFPLPFGQRGSTIGHGIAKKSALWDGEKVCARLGLAIVMRAIS